MSSPLISRMQPFGTTIFAEMSALAARTGAINLGQGYPDTDGPREMLEAAKAAIDGGRNQYPPGPGVPELLEAISLHQKRFYGLPVDPDSEVLVTVGATEAIAAVVLALCEPGDEVVTFEPYYDSYAATIALAGATRRTSVLRFPDFAVDEASLRSAFSDRTRLVLLNTPHNPTGKVFTRAELELVAALAREHDAWVVTDEVYEHLVFDGRRAHSHGDPARDGGADASRSRRRARPSRRPAGRSAGSTGPAEAVAAARTVKQFLTYVASGPFQPAVAAGARNAGTRCTRPRGIAAGKRDLLCDGLANRRVDRVAAPGTYFVIADAARLGAVDALAFCPWAAGAGWRGRGAGVGVPRRPGGGADPGPVRVLQAGRGADGGEPATRCSRSGLTGG